MKKKLELTEILFYRRMLIIPRAEHVSKEEISRKIEKKKHNNRIRKAPLKFLELKKKGIVKFKIHGTC